MPDPFAYRNPDGTLRLDEVLGERCVRHYTRILSSSNEQFAAMQLSMGAEAPGEDGRGAYSRQEPRRGVITDDGWLLSPEGASDRRASSCTELAVQPSFCWDVCGYYRRLGVGWRASKREIAQAQLRIDPGRDDGQVSYAVAQLLDPVIRRAYDRMPLGGLFLGDRDVREVIERAAAREAARRNAEAAAADPGAYARAMDVVTDQGEVLREWGFDKDGVSAEEARERLADTPFRQGRSSDELGSSLSSWELSWGWYRMTDPYDDDPWQGTAPGALAVLLERWQAMIARAFSLSGERVEFAVGTWTGHGPRSWRDSKECCIVFFIGTGRITQQAADEVVRGYVAAGNSREQQGTAGKNREKRNLMAILAKGATAAAKLAEEEKKNRPGGFYRVPDLFIKDGESYLLRFVTEIGDLTTFQVHRFMPTKPQPPECKWPKWPAKMWGICQHDKAFRVRDKQGNPTDEFEDGYGNCYLCNTYGGVFELVQGRYKIDQGRPDTLTYGLAVLCKVINDPATGNVTGFAEETTEFKPAADIVIGGEVIARKGDILNLPKIVMVAMRWTAFWHPVEASAFLTPGVIRDKVFTVSRKDKDYIVTPVATDPPGARTWEKYERVLEIIGFNLDDHLVEHSTADHYAKFFDPTRLPADGYARKDDAEDEAAPAGEQPGPATAAPGPDIDQAAIADFASRLKSRGAAASS